MSSNAVKLMPHPAFVYTAQFHPRVNKVVATGGYDKTIRVWSLQTDDDVAHVCIVNKATMPMYVM